MFRRAPGWPNRLCFQRFWSAGAVMTVAHNGNILVADEQNVQATPSRVICRPVVTRILCHIIDFHLIPCRRRSLSLASTAPFACLYFSIVYSWRIRCRNGNVKWTCFILIDLHTEFACLNYLADFVKCIIVLLKPQWIVGCEKECTKEFLKMWLCM